MVIVVGSGAGGATVAKELAARRIPVKLIERGPAIEEREAFKCYSRTDTEVAILRTVCLGGSTVVSAGNGMRLRCLESELRERNGIDLRAELDAAERELGVSVLPDVLFGEGTKRIMDAAMSLGFSMEKMPKFIDGARCKPGGRCVFGCPEGAKWTALRFVREAERAGAEVVVNTAVDEVVVKGGEVKGVRCGEKMIRDDIVVLSAGALDTPRLLEKSGLPASSDSLFVDTFITIGGVLRGIGLNREVTMNSYIGFEEFMLAPHFSNHLVSLLRQGGKGRGRGLDVSSSDVIGIMVKIRDEEQGEVKEVVSKGVTGHDAANLAEGASIAGSILEAAGVDPATFVVTPLRGAHPGGTAKIGVAVDRDLATEVEGLYVVDASVLPEAPGGPPILTIVALAKYLTRRLTGSCS